MGRPAGQPNKLTREMKERAAFWGDKALERIVKLIDSEDDSIALRAASELLDRGFGKPAQTQIHVGDEEGGAINTNLRVNWGDGNSSPAGIPATQSPEPV